MKNRNIIIGLIIVIALVFTGVVIMKSLSVKKPSGNKSLSVKPPAVQPSLKTSVKKVISKEMGALIVKVVNSKGKDLHLRIRAFKTANASSSLYSVSMVSSRAQELQPGNYDIEIETIPQMIYKNVSVSRAKETIIDINALGSINVKALNYQKRDASFPVRIFNPKSNIPLVTMAANRSIDLVRGTYDIDIGTAPVQRKNGVLVESGKESVIDIGCVTGKLLVKAIDENKKELKYQLRVKKSGTNEFVASGVSGRAIEIMSGVYDVDILSNPAQSRKGVEIKPGEETAAEFIVQSAAKIQAPAPAVKSRK